MGLIVEDPAAATNRRAAAGGRHPDEAEPRRNIVHIASLRSSDTAPVLSPAVRGRVCRAELDGTPVLPVVVPADVLD